MSKAHAPAQPQACFSGKTLPPCPGLWQVLFHMKEGNSVINKLSIHFYRELFLLFSHNMLFLFCLGGFLKKENKTKSTRPRVPLWQGGHKAVFGVGGSVLVVLSLCWWHWHCHLCPLCLLRVRGQGHHIPHRSLLSIRGMGEEGWSCSGVGNWDFGASRENRICLPSFLLWTRGNIEAMPLATTGGLFLTILEAKSSSVGCKRRVSLPGEAGALPGWV